MRTFPYAPLESKPVAANWASVLRGQAWALEDAARFFGRDRILKALAGTGGAEASSFVDGNEIDGEIISLGIHAGDPFDRFDTGVLRVQPLAHVLHHHEAAAETHHVFTNARGTGGADFVVDVQSAADDRGIADAPREFVSHAAGGAAPVQVAVGCQQHHGDGVVAFEFLALLLAPFQPFFSARRGDFGAALESMQRSELFGAGADQEYVFGGFHDAARDGNGVDESFDRCDAAGAVPGAGHDTGVERDDPFGIGDTTESDAFDPGGFALIDAEFNGVDRTAT